VIAMRTKLGLTFTTTIALAVLVENGGHGGSTAAPIARAVLDFYLLGKEPAVKREAGEEGSEND